MLSRVGTPSAPITVRGVLGPPGERPVLDGNGATTRPQLDYGNVIIEHPDSGNNDIVLYGGDGASANHVTASGDNLVTTGPRARRA